MKYTNLDAGKYSSSSKGVGDNQHQIWNILAEDVSLPVALIKHSAIQNNLDWMAHYTSKTNVKLAPHGKTSMAPELFKAQIASGAWAMSLATAPQVAAACENGLQRIIMANQLVGKRNMAITAGLITKQHLEYYCFIDSLDNAKILNEYFADAGISLNVLIEYGVAGGRCGVRSNTQAQTLAQQVQHLPALSLRGIAFYEGVIRGENQAQDIAHFVGNIKTLALKMAQQQLFAEGEVIITGAGSAWYDIVAEQLNAPSLPTQFHVVIRPGCYLIHDTGIYQQAQDALRQRSQLACDINGDLISALEVWAYVQSVPEPGMAIVGLGKRDAAFDAGLPTPEYHYRPGADTIKSVGDEWKLTKIMDQHAMLSLPPDSNIQVGDMLGFSTSHPCLTLDKWRTLAIVDEQYQVTRLIETRF